jgi:hypothetical protein
MVLAGLLLGLRRVRRRRGAALGIAAATLAACTAAAQDGADGDATGSSNASTANDVTTTITTQAPDTTLGEGEVGMDGTGPGPGTSGDDPSSSTGDGPIDSADFETRCTQAGVLVCVGFDDPADLEGTFGDNHGILVGAATPELDPTTKASGASALRFTVPSNSGADTSGSYFTNFSEDLETQFDGDSTFFVQWRQRFTAEQITTFYGGGGGWKQAILGVGDQPGCSASNAINISNGGSCASSCTELETVVQNTGQRGFSQMYNSCSGSASHGPYDAFEEPFDAFDFKLQNARPDPYCLYSQSETGYLPPQGNCFGYSADEWMTFQVEVSTGPREGDEFVDSQVRLWIATQGQPSELVLDWGPYNLTAGDPAQNLRFGKVWLLPYNTGKSEAQDHPVAYTWYDELIVSTERIADPS